MKNKAFFLDRDGTVIEDGGYLCHFSQAVIYPFSVEAIQRMNKAGYRVILVSNQSAIARGMCSEEEVDRFFVDLIGHFRKQNAIIDDFYYCPTHPEGIVPAYRKDDPRRKPGAGMLLEAAEEHEIDLSQSYMAGDHVSDVEAGINAGCRSILVRSGHWHGELPDIPEKSRPDLLTDNILTAVERILD